MSSVAPEHAAAAPATREEIARAVNALVDECRVECLWSLRRDYYPSTDVERLRILDAIQRSSNREVFQRAGVLKAWLSRDSSEGSARS
jgi:hypothetical protein